MIKLEVTGATPEEFAQNAMSAWGLLAIGLHRALQPRTDGLANLLGEMQDAEVMSGSESSSTASKVVHSDPVEDLFTEKEASAPAPENSASAPRTRTSAAKTAAKSPKLDDLKTRLSEVIVAATERWDQKRANAYARKLLKSFDVEKLGELKPEQYLAFDLSANCFVAGDIPE